MRYYPILLSMIFKFQTETLPVFPGLLEHLPAVISCRYHRQGFALGAGG